MRAADAALEALRGLDRYAQEAAHEAHAGPLAVRAKLRAALAVADADHRDPNELARQLAEARDQITDLRRQLLDAQETAGRWASLFETIDYARDGLVTVEALQAFDYDTMLEQGMALLEKAKDAAFEAGEREGMENAVRLLSDAVKALMPR